MIEPVRRDDAFLQEVRSTVKSTDLNLWWLGQSGFLLQWAGHHLLLDPYLSDSLTRKYAGTDKPHERLTARVVDPARLDFINLVTSSHNHTDHLDADTLRPLLRCNPAMRLVVPSANRAFALERLPEAHQRLRSLDAGESESFDVFRLHGVPAAHNTLEVDSAGHHKYLGYVVEAGPWRIYHSGDTKRYTEMEQWFEGQRIDVALLPINGDRPERRVAGNLEGAEAAELAKALGARVVIPCHYEMFAFNTVSPEEFTRACERVEQHYRLLRCGERWSTAELEPLV